MTDMSGAGSRWRCAAQRMPPAEVRGEKQVSVVWTGPASYEVPVRATSAVLAKVIEENRKSLIIVSFAAYKVAAVVEALRASADRGVDVRLVLESPVESNSKLTYAQEAFEALSSVASFYVSPAELRDTQGSGHASMHAKLRGGRSPHRVRHLGQSHRCRHDR